MKAKKIVFEKLTVEEKERTVGGNSPQGMPECMEGGSHPPLPIEGGNCEAIVSD